MNSEEYKIEQIYRKRLMNAKGYVMFWEEHVKKLPDEFALKMLEVAKKILTNTEKKLEELNKNPDTMGHGIYHKTDNKG